MKLYVTMKTPDACEHAIEEYVEHEFDASKETDLDAKDMLREEAIEFLGRWVDFGELVTLEFDTVAGTCTVKERRR